MQNEESERVTINKCISSIFQQDARKKKTKPHKDTKMQSLSVVHSDFASC
jgi:hypothetical protein